MIREQRRIDPSGEVSQVAQGVVRLGLRFGEHRRGSVRIRRHESLREAELHGQRDQLLLRTVVDVAFELLRPGVLRRHDPPSRFPEVLDQSDVPEHQPRLRRHVASELLLGRVHRIVRRDGHGERAEELALVTHLEGGVLPEVRDVVSDRHVGRRGRAFGPDALLTHLVTDPQPHPRDLGAGGLAEQRDHPRQDVVEGVGPADPLAELGQHLVRRRSLPVHEPIREPLGAGANEEEDRWPGPRRSRPPERCRR